MFSHSILALVVALVVVLQVAQASYVAAVAEHTVFSGYSNPADNLNKNLEIYANLTSLAKTNGAQILVFPEFGLTPVNPSQRSDLYPFIEVIPNVDQSKSLALPCNDASFSDKPILSQMSCIAKTNKISLLVNMIDRVDCQKSLDASCPDDGHYQYNTDVVFNENGELAAKYHKSHEFPPFIPIYDQVPSPSEVTYKASFGVEFGLFICYDIMFETPAKSLRAKGIEHFLYAVSQGKVGESTLIEPWSGNNKAVILSSNLGSGKSDCSGIVVNGTPLQASKFHLTNKDFADDNVLIATVNN